MKCREIIHKIEEVFPKSLALEWDNVGLLAGSSETEVRKIYLALDATEEVIEAAKGADLLITHHPMIFSPLRRVTDADFIGKRLLTLIQRNTAYYAMHTNYDVGRMSTLAAEYLGLSDPEILKVTGEAQRPAGIGRVADLTCPVSLADYCEVVKRAFDLSQVQVFGSPDRKIRRVAISPGSGESMIEQALSMGADVLVTGDIGHHGGIDAVAQGLSIIDAGHYGIEHIFVKDMKQFLEQRFPELTVVADVERHPFVML